MNHPYLDQFLIAARIAAYTVTGAAVCHAIDKTSSYLERRRGHRFNPTAKKRIRQELLAQIPGQRTEGDAS